MTITETIGGKDRVFTLLSVDDLVSLTNTMPVAATEVIDLPALDKWSKNPQGCEHFLWASARKIDPLLARESIRGWGSILRRTNLANRIFIESITSGEETPNPKAEGQTTPPTTT